MIFTESNLHICPPSRSQTYIYRSQTYIFACGKLYFKCVNFAHFDPHGVKPIYSRSQTYIFCGFHGVKPIYFDFFPIIKMTCSRIQNHLFLRLISYGFFDAGVSPVRRDNSAGKVRVWHNRKFCIYQLVTLSGWVSV